MKKKKSEKGDEEKSIVENFLGGVPGFGNFFKSLGKTEVFQKRFKEVNGQIEENLRKGAEKNWDVEGHVSVRPLSARPSIRPLVGEIKKETPDAELKIGKDYAYGKKENKLMLAVKVLKKDASAILTGRYVLVKGDNFRKKIELPGYYKKIAKKQCKRGVLMLELTK